MNNVRNHWDANMCDSTPFSEKCCHNWGNCSCRQMRRKNNFMAENDILSQIHATEVNIFMLVNDEQSKTSQKFKKAWLFQYIPPSVYLTGTVACTGFQSHLCTGPANHNHTLTSPVCRMLVLLASAKQVTKFVEFILTFLEQLPLLS